MSNTTPLCEQCAASGLPVLPVRYAVIPSNPAVKLPDWATGERIKEVPLSRDYNYALRALREGYLYIFYSRNHDGPNQWECYVVGEDGSLRKQYNPEMTFRQSTPVFQCARSGHNPLGMHYLVIERPDKCGQTWLAFSETKWSPETLAEYTRNAALRNRRMQSIHPAQMVSGARQLHGTPATPAALGEVLEYSDASSASLARPEALTNAISEENGSCKKDLLAFMSTRYPLHLRRGQAPGTVEHMQKRGKTPKGPATPHVLALWDAVGMAHELNGFRNDAAGWLDKYREERALQITALHAIDGTRAALANKGRERLQQHQKRVISRSRFETALRVKPHPYGWSESARWVPFKSAEDITAHGPGMGYVILTDGDIDQSIARDWKKYEDKLDPKALEAFRKHWHQTLDDADTLIDRRTVALVNWLEAKLFIDTLEDFHPTNIEDGVMFEDVVGEAIFGMGSSKSGQQKIDAWVKEAKASIKSNLLWRAVALNQETGIAEVDAALAAAEQHKSQRTMASALNTEGVVAKLLKTFADTHKKAVGILSANTSAQSDKGSVVFGTRLKPIKTRGIDQLLTTAGDRIVAHFKVDGLADHLSEKIIQHMLSLRAMVDKNDSLALLVAQAAAEPASRGHLLRRMQAAETFLGESTLGIKNAQTETLRKAWENIKTSSAGANALRDARLAVVVMLIEGLNFQKLLVECKTRGDGKTYLSLAASGMTISSGLFDIASVPAKNIFGAESWSYQKIKLAGGVLSVGATGVGVWLDIEDAIKNASRGNNLIKHLYEIKAGLGGANLALTLATTFTYAAPLIGRLTGSEVYAGAARAVGTRAAAVIGTRILFMSLGAWLTAGTFGVQILIWIFTDDELQSWCERSAFGVKRDPGWSAKRQMDEYLQALQSVGISK